MCQFLLFKMFLPSCKWDVHVALMLTDMQTLCHSIIFFIKTGLKAQI